MKTKCVFVFCTFVLSVSTTYAVAVEDVWNPPVYLPSDTCRGQNKCAVHEIRIESCNNTVQNEPCRLQMGANLTVSFDYTTNFNSAMLESRIRIDGKNVNIVLQGTWFSFAEACQYTSCPAIAGKRTTYTSNLGDRVSQRLIDWMDYIQWTNNKSSWKMGVELKEEGQKHGCCSNIEVEVWK